MKILKRKLPIQVFLLGAVSFFNDTASEMLYPIMPVFLTETLGAPVYIVGVIEGVAEGVASLCKTLFGYWSDRIGKRKPFMVTGYGASTVSKLILAGAFSWPVVFLGRLTDKFGKGLRTASRDAMLLEASDADNKGYVFGFHRAMDTAGAVVGPGIALLLLGVFHDNIRVVLRVAVIPGIIALLFFFFVKEIRKREVVAAMPAPVSISGLSPQLKRFFLGLAVFSLGNSADSFLILRAKGVGLTTLAAIGAYMVYNFVYASASLPAGIISDRIGPKRVFMAGIFIFMLVYGGFAAGSSPVLIWILFAVYGFYIALTDGVAKALVGGMIDSRQSGAVYGLMNTVMGLCTILASIIGGFLWSTISPTATFIFSMVCASVSLIIFSSMKPSTHPSTSRIMV
jgi:MFS family permease